VSWAGWAYRYFGRDCVFLLFFSSGGRWLGCCAGRGLWTLVLSLNSAINAIAILDSRLGGGRSGARPGEIDSVFIEARGQVVRRSECRDRGDVDTVG
jgi:hypothetical protein